ncbi:light-harvesting complex protein [Aureococcus anophagefferens]|uniref:Light-harvesting complex protein n=1 Tax=Aureococcus anophagefferens TaxID=44056 RepID=A0ABR1G4I8_AURAN
MQKLIIASSIATASAFVAPTSTASASTLKAQESMEGPTVDPWYMDGKEPDLSKIRGVFPGKSMPADYGFDPLGVAAIDVFSSDDDDYLRVKNYRDAELRHGRLAMLAAAAWPVQELVHPWLNKALDAPNLLSDGRSPSVLNGGLGDGPIPLALAFTAIMAGLLDIRAIDIKERTGYDKWIPGDYGFDPLNIVKGASPVAFKNMQAKEINNGRLAMVAVACYVAQEAATGEPIVALSEGLFTPIIYMPWFQHVMDTAFGISSFRV